MTLSITNRALFVLLVDSEGRILLQLRASQAPVSPHQRSVPGANRHRRGTGSRCPVRAAGRDGV